MIGIFDSGVGGFSVLKKLRERSPHADILYFGDIKHAPYGNRSKDELVVLTMHSIEVLLAHGVTEIVSACNSVSESIAQVGREKFNAHFEYIDMSGPTINFFHGSPKSVLVVGTKATIDSEIYQRGLSNLGLTVGALAIPDLARAIEDGEDTAHIDAILKQAFENISVVSYGTVLLACTHFPLVLESFQKIVPESTTLFDPAVPVAGEIMKRFHVDGNGRTRFLLSKDSPVFRSYVSRMIYRDAPIEIV